ncbi:acyltransferase family protein [Klebsiella pneumoniae]|uniref:acyltransferase family protein n=1 Tax=Klebsiella pneumoniae TaxID=573 RepID=UPI00320ED64F|nr:acyltransferase [Klebsiella pneumoniae]HBT3843877.1 acyltransferase [Klebsiella pneumoniae]HBZ1358838.1 acyltransferase [Klebsiella pneumoniae]
MKHIKELDGLRGLMALWVVAGHAYEAIPSISRFIPMTLMNDFAVDVFIVLSGFVIFNYLNTNPGVSYKKYIKQRALRLFPIYLVVTALTISSIYFYRDILTDAPLSPSTEYRIYQIDVFLNDMVQHIIPHLFLLQGIIPERILHLSGTTIVGQAWSASVEWQFYLIAPFLFIFFDKVIKFPTVKKTFIIILFVIVFLIFSKLMYNKAFIGTGAGPFFVGFMSFYFLRDVYHRISTQSLILISLCTIIATILLLKKDCVGYLIWFVVFSAVLIKNKLSKENVITKLFDNKISQVIGKVSYSVYMIHMLVIYFVLYLMVSFSLPLSMYILLVPLSMVASVIISIYTYKYIEYPMMQLGKREPIAQH